MSIESSSFDDLIDMWSKSKTNMALHEFVGMTKEDYRRWVRTNAIDDDMLKRARRSVKRHLEAEGLRFDE